MVVYTNREHLGFHHCFGANRERLCVRLYCRCSPSSGVVVMSSPYVAIVGGVRRERLAAVFALKIEHLEQFPIKWETNPRAYFEWSFSAMLSYVGPKDAAGGERLGAIATFVRAFAGMNTKMLQIMRGFEMGAIPLFCSWKIPCSNWTTERSACRTLGNNAADGSRVRAICVYGGGLASRTTFDTGDTGTFYRPSRHTLYI